MKALILSLALLVTACGRTDGPLPKYADWSVDEASVSCVSHGQTLEHCRAYFECVQDKTGQLYVGQIVDKACELQVTPK